MAEREDHVEYARALLAEAQGKGLEKAAVIVADAQVHATLALVEQQRIANLIALSQATYADGSRVMGLAISRVTDEYSAVLNDDIKEGLGL